MHIDIKEKQSMGHIYTKELFVYNNKFVVYKEGWKLDGKEV